MTDFAINNAGATTTLKSYLSAEEREEILKAGGIDLVYVSESLEAGEAGNEDDAWAWLSRAQLPATALLRMKWSLGAQFIRDMQFKTKLADEAYGSDWLDNASL